VKLPKLPFSRGASMADDLEDEWWLESSENASKKKSNEGVTGK